MLSDGCSVAAAEFPGADTSTKLKLFGRGRGQFRDAIVPTNLDVCSHDAVAARDRKLVMSDAAGLCSVWRAWSRHVSYGTLRPLVRPRLPGRARRAADRGDQRRCPCRRTPMSAPATPSPGHDRTASTTAPTLLPRSSPIPAREPRADSCVPTLRQLPVRLRCRPVQRAVVETSAVPRRTVRDSCWHRRAHVQRLIRPGTGTASCDISKPVGRVDPGVAGTVTSWTASRPRSRTPTDHFLANIQRNGTVLVVPASPAARITPAKLDGESPRWRGFRALHEDPAASGSTCSGGDRRQLPLIWRRLWTAGFESGHATARPAHGEVVASARRGAAYGVQDSVEPSRSNWSCATAACVHRTRSSRRVPAARGVRRPGERDVGVIATEHGWNLYVGATRGSPHGTRICWCLMWTQRRWCG